MKRILITGENSYIGTSLENYLKAWPKQYQVDTLNMVDGSWKEKSFQGYDVIFHVAGIVHQKETKENARLYYEINRDMAIEAAKKGKEEGVGQFIFMSSMNVYGMNVGVITKEVKPNPKSNYGKSKLQAEEMLREMETDAFKVCVLRPPMVYGYGCKGNFQTLVKFVGKTPVFPKINNQRSMLYIDNLSSFVKLLIDKECRGLFFPQNKEYGETVKIAKIVAAQKGRKLCFSSLAGLGIHMLKPFLTIVKKSFGTLIYKDTEEFDYSYCEISFEESVAKSIEKEGF